MTFAEEMKKTADKANQNRKKHLPDLIPYIEANLRQQVRKNSKQGFYRTTVNLKSILKTTAQDVCNISDESAILSNIISYYQTKLNEIQAEDGFDNPNNNTLIEIEDKLLLPAISNLHLKYSFSILRKEFNYDFELIWN